MYWLIANSSHLKGKQHEKHKKKQKNNIILGLSFKYFTRSCEYL